MSNIDRILEFIDGSDKVDVKEDIKEDKEETVNETLKEDKEDLQKIQDESLEGNEYKRLMRSIKKIDRFPNIVNIGGMNRIVNTQEELNALETTIRKGRREYLRNRQKETIKPIKEKLKKYSQTEEDINESGIIYKRNKKPSAIDIEGDIVEIPKTNKEDRKKIYNSIDKENIKKLVQAKNKEEFERTTEEAIKDDTVKDIYNIHKTVKDNTWTRPQLLKYIESLQNQSKVPIQKPSKVPIQQPILETVKTNPYGFNPKLFKKG